MKRLILLATVWASILCICFVSGSWAQQKQGVPPFGRHSILRQRMMNRMTASHGVIGYAGFFAPASVADNVRTWDLGIYPGGTWAEAGGVNDFGVMVAEGDAADADNHLFRIELFGPHAGQWSDMDALGAYEGWFTWQLIADSGLMVGYAATGDYVHGFVWTGESEKTDLGALPRLGRNNSVAQAVNKHGTLVAGYVWGKTIAKLYPVVWTPNITWESGRATITWNIHELPTPKGLPFGFVFGINGYGQLAGAIYNNKGVYVAALWNPTLDGNGWDIIQLPSSENWASAIAGDINEKGEIVGDVLSPDFAHGYASLWQPADPQRRTYKLIPLPNPWGHPNGDTAEGINNSGDIVGASWDDLGNVVAVRWTTKDASSVQSLGFPGDWSLAFRVNEYGIATGTYGTYSAGQCANECVAAVQFH
jgi:hypothetical protein